MALEGKGLAFAVSEYATVWSRQNGIAVGVRVQEERSLLLTVEQTIFRIVEEALSNIARHSNASSATIRLIYTKLDLTCGISDDGGGFDTGKKHSGFGLRSMQERVNALGSKLTIESDERKGTRISFVIPLSRVTKNEENQPCRTIGD